MIRKMSIKPSYFNIPFTLLYPGNIVWQVMIIIVARCCVFPYNDDNVVLTRISHMIYIKHPKMGNDVLKFSKLVIIYILLSLQCHVFILNGLWLSRFCRSSLSNAIAASLFSIVFWWASFVISRAWTRLGRPSIFIACDLSLSYCRTWGNNTLQQYFLNAFAFDCWLGNNSSYIPSSLV